MKVRQKWKSLALCLFMLMTLLYSLIPINVNAEEKLFKAEDGVFMSDTLVFRDSEDMFFVGGISLTDTKYKYITQYDGNYYYFNQTTVSREKTSNIDEAIQNCTLVGKGDFINLLTNVAVDAEEKDFKEKLSSYKTLVYDEKGDLIYTIPQTDLYKYAENTSISHDVSVQCTGDFTNASGIVVGKNYKVTPSSVSYISLCDAEGSYYCFEGTDSFGLQAPNGDFTYEITLSDGYVYTGKLTQDGVPDASKIATDEYNKNTPIAEDIKYPTVNVSDIPTKKCDSFTLTISTDMDCEIEFNGSGSGSYTKSAKFKVEDNGTFTYSATSPDGGCTTGSITVSCIKDDGEENEKWSPANWSGDSSDTGNPNIVQTGIFGSMKIFRYIGIVLVCLGFGVLLLKKKGFSFKKGGKQ